MVCKILWQGYFIAYLLTVTLYQQKNKKIQVMNTNAFCPISEKKVDDHVARLNGGITLTLLILFSISSNVIPVLILLVDFALRSGSLSRLSIFSFVSRYVLKTLAVKPEMINAGPKIFAARIGLFFSIAIIVSYILGIDSLVYALSGIFAICAFLESFFGYCVACQIYPFVYKLFYNSDI